jgi:ankyrin repeat protein
LLYNIADDVLRYQEMVCFRRDIDKQLDCLVEEIGYPVPSLVSDSRVRFENGTWLLKPYLPTTVGDRFVSTVSAVVSRAASAFTKKKQRNLKECNKNEQHEDKFWRKIEQKAEGLGKPSLDKRNIQYFITKYWPKSWNESTQSIEGREQSFSAWLTPSLISFGDLTCLKARVSFDEYRGLSIFEIPSILHNLIESSAAAELVAFILQQPLILPHGMEKADPFACSLLNEKDVSHQPCDACCGAKAAVHTCSGVTSFAFLVRLIQKLAIKVQEVQSQVNVLQGLTFNSEDLFESLKAAVFVNMTRLSKNVEDVEDRRKLRTSWEKTAKSKEWFLMLVKRVTSHLRETSITMGLDFLKRVVSRQFVISSSVLGKVPRTLQGSPLSWTAGFLQEITLLGGALLREDLKRELFDLTDKLSNSISTIRIFLQQGASAVASTSDVDVVARVVEMDFLFLKPMIRTELEESLTYLIQLLIDDHNQQCTEGNQRSQLLAWFLYGYSTPLPISLEKCDSYIRLMRQITAEQKRAEARVARLDLLSRESCLSWEFLESNKTSRYSLRISTSIEEQKVIWYSASLPLWRHGDLENVDGCSDGQSFWLTTSILDSSSGRIHRSKEVKKTTRKMRLSTESDWGKASSCPDFLSNRRLGFLMGNSPLHVEATRQPLAGDFLEGFQYALCGPCSVLARSLPSPILCALIRAMVALICRCSGPSFPATSFLSEMLQLIIRCVTKFRQEAFETMVETASSLLTQVALQSCLNSCNGWLNTTPLQCAAALGRVDVVRRLLSLRANAGLGQWQNGHTPLHLACAFGHLETASLLLQEDTSACNKPDAQGRTPLYLTLCSNCGNWQAVAELLLERSADPFIKSADGYSPMQLALMFHGAWLASLKWEPVISALSASASRSKLRGMPMHAIAESAMGSADELNLLARLLQAGADVLAVRMNLRRESALHVTSTVDVANALLQSNKGNSEKPILFALDWRDNTPLHCACASSNLPLVTLLVEAGADFGRVAVNCLGQSPFDLATGSVRAYLVTERCRREEERVRRIEVEKLKRKEEEEGQMKVENARFLSEIDKVLSTLVPVEFERAGPEKQNIEDEVPDDRYALDEEQERIVRLEVSTSLLVLGRSGTGKTTVAVQRMARAHKESRGSLKQVFLTMNPILLDCVRRSFHMLVPDRSGGALAPSSILEAKATDFPLFMDLRDWMKFLIKSLPARTFERSPVVAAFMADEEQARGQGIIGGEVNISLFVSQMWQRMMGHKSWRGGGPTQKKAGKKGQIVERALSPNAVFAEISSIIKGSWEALDSPDGYLSLKDYLALPAKLGAFAGASEVREEMYELFVKYQIVRDELGCYDWCDVIFAVHKGLEVCTSDPSALYLEDAPRF